MEQVALSSASLVTLKRIYLNLLSGREECRSFRRHAVKELGVPDRFLVERRWALRGERYEYQGSAEEARKDLDELLVVRPEKVEKRDAPTAGAVDDQVVEQVLEAMLREERAPGVWSFGCVFRMSPTQLANMLRLTTSPVEAVDAAVRHLIENERLNDLKGTLGLEKNGFIYVRE